jgi:hypothetical protein
MPVVFRYTSFRFFFYSNEGNPWVPGLSLGRGAKFGGMDVPHARRLRELEGENAKLEKLLAEAHLDMHALKCVLGVRRQPDSSSARLSPAAAVGPSAGGT